MSATPIPDNAARFTPDELVEATGGRWLAPPTRALEGVQLDSRRVAPGNVFVALKGETHDAHDYLPQVMAAGAHAVVVDRDVEAPEGVGVLRVEDTLTALGALGALHRRRFDVPVVCITGSVGKTTTKELVAAALTGLGHATVFTRGNLNNRVGVPMTLFTLDATHDAAVIELGMSEPGEIADLAAMAQPTIGLVTSVAAVHTEGVGGIDGVAREKGALLEALSPDGAAIWFVDDAPLAAYAERSAAKTKIGYGTVEAADVRLARWELDGEAHTRAHVTFEGGSVDVALSLLGQAAAINATGAVAVMRALAPEKLEAGAAALTHVPQPPHRMVPVAVADDVLVIDDTYNASPRSTEAALDTAAALASARGGRLIAVLGDMLELGRHEEHAHAEVGREVVRVGAAHFICCGERMAHAGRAALSATMERSQGARTKILLLKNVDDAAGCVRDVVRPRDVVLVKGSRGMRMERVVAQLGDAG